MRDIFGLIVSMTLKRQTETLISGRHLALWSNVSQFFTFIISEYIHLWLMLQYFPTKSISHVNYLNNFEIVINSFNINKTNDHILTDWTLKGQQHMMLDVHTLACKMHKNVARLNRLIRIQPSPPDNWISNCNTYINKL